MLPRTNGWIYRTYRVLRYAWLTLQKAGPGVFLYQLGRQLYSHTIFLGLEKRLDESIPGKPSAYEYTLTPASPEDVDEFFQKMAYETKKSRYQVLERRWFYESGFHNCYVARASDTNELCHIRWLVTSQDEKVRAEAFGSRLPKLKEDEVLSENVYTLEKYRGKGIQISVGLQVAEIARKQGFRRLITYVAEDNIASLRGSKRVGYQAFEMVSQRHILFRTVRKTIQKMSPPVPISIPRQDNASASS